MDSSQLRNEESRNTVTKRAWVVNSPSVVSEIIDGELVVMNLATGNYFSSTGTGALIWARIGERQDDDAVVAAVVAAYDVTRDRAAADFATFVAELAAAELVRAEEASEAMAPPAPGRREAYAKPELKVYTDMKDLLMLDPIHDVGADGWPAVAPEMKKAV
jgi:hypothetical protein